MPWLTRVKSTMLLDPPQRDAAKESDGRVQTGRAAKTEAASVEANALVVLAMFRLGPDEHSVVSTVVHASDSFRIV
jgi:hypothetical protein